MANTLGVYDPIFYAQEALIQLEKSLGMAARVHRSYEAERGTFNKGQTININRPGSFTAQNAPSPAQDITPDTVSITLDKWKEVKFELTDQQLAYTTEKIIEDHIRPAAVALADNVDSTLMDEYKNVPWFHDAAGTTDHTDITLPRKILFDNFAPVMDDANMHLIVNSTLEANFLGLNIFHQAQVAGEGANIEALLRGSLGRRFGFEVSANQNIKSHVKGTCSTSALVVNGAQALGLTTVNVDAASVTGTLVAGDTFVFGGHSQRYSVTAVNTAASNAFTAVAIFPALKAAIADAETCTVSLDNHTANLAFHKNAFSLVMVKLPETGDGIGARIATVQDPLTNLALRSRIYYDGANSKVVVALDMLYGLKTLDPNLAVRLRG